MQPHNHFYCYCSISRHNTQSIKKIGARISCVRPDFYHGPLSPYGASGLQGVPNSRLGVLDESFRLQVPAVGQQLNRLFETFPQP